jgi:hypothetical protein
MTLPTIPEAALEKLANAANMWFASVRPDARPHLTPVWFVHANRRVYVSIDPKSVKFRNLAANPNVALALEDGNHPLIGEGQAALIDPPYPDEVVQLFQKKYDWDITTEGQYSQLVEIKPRKWIGW